MIIVVDSNLILLLLLYHYMMSQSLCNCFFFWYWLITWSNTCYTNATYVTESQVNDKKPNRDSCATLVDALAGVKNLIFYNYVDCNLSLKIHNDWNGDGR